MHSILLMNRHNRPGIEIALPRESPISVCREDLFAGSHCLSAQRCGLLAGGRFRTAHGLPVPHSEPVVGVQSLHRKGGTWFKTCDPETGLTLTASG